MLELATLKDLVKARSYSIFLESPAFEEMAAITPPSNLFCSLSEEAIDSCAVSRVHSTPQPTFHFTFPPVGEMFPQGPGVFCWLIDTSSPHNRL
jgi:hypothetical protein